VLKDRLDAAGGDAFKAQITELDNSVGRVMETLEKSGIAENTLVFFTNDNGGGGKASGGPLRGAKFGPKYEGHMRVATLAWWPGTIPAGAVTSEIGTTTDMLPTIAKLAGAKVPSDRIIDGKDISDVLLGKKGAKSPHTTLFYETDGVRQGNWKYVRYRKKADRFEELYRLDLDLGEKNNLAAKHPERVKAMRDVLDKHKQSIRANIRPAGMAKDPKPILTDPSGLPTLYEYRKKPTTKQLRFQFRTVVCRCRVRFVAGGLHARSKVIMRVLQGAVTL
jgi:arylsulfatase A